MEKVTGTGGGGRIGFDAGGPGIADSLKIRLGGWDLLSEGKD